MRLPLLFDAHAVRNRRHVEHAPGDRREGPDDRFTAIGWAEKHDAAAASGATDLSAPGAGRARGSDRGIDLRRGDPVDQGLPTLPLLPQSITRGFEVSGLESSLHLHGILRNAREPLLHLLLLLDL